MARKIFSPKTARALREMLKRFRIYEPIVTETPDAFWENERKQWPEDIEMINAEEQRYRAAIIDLRKTKLDALRLCYGIMNDDAEGWKQLSIALAYQLYPGFDTVEKPPKSPKNKTWSAQDRANLVKRVRLEMKGQWVLLKVAIANVIEKHPDDYKTFSAATIEARYHEFRAERRAEWRKLIANGVSALELLMSGENQANASAACRDQVKVEVERAKVDLSAIPAISRTKH